MKIRFLPIVFIVLGFLTIASLVIAASFESNLNLNRADAGLNIFLNFTVSNNETTSEKNITQVNITLPSVASFVTGYNGTAGNSTPTSFSYTSVARNATWTNTTPTGFIQNWTTAYFWFNITLDKNAAGNYNFTISTLDNSSVFNSTNFTIFIERTGWSSPLEQFYVKPVEILLNWTNFYRTNITLTVNQSVYNLTLKLLNGTDIDTSKFSQNYTQDNTQDPCKTLRLLVQNTTDIGNYVGLLNATSGENAMNVSLIVDTSILSQYHCLPGRYRIANFTITNATRTNESVNISVILDVPIDTNSTFSNSTGIGTFKGTMLNNSAYYHFYVFNTSLLTNATGLTINMSWSSSSQDMDVFLFDSSGNVRAKSINKNGTTERLYYNFLNYTSPALWEIRIYGNSTSIIPYDGSIFFTTLNTTNSSIDFGIMNVTSNSTWNVGLKNEGNVSLSSVTESKELYHVRRFVGNGTSNFTFLVPSSSIATKVKVILNWTGATNYTFNLYDSSGTLLGSSINNHVYANKTGATQEEYNETTSIGSSSGLWKVEVKNDTSVALTNPYNLTVYTYVSSSTWLSTNYSSMTFNTSGTNNSVVNITVNFTNGIPTTAVDGIYEGYLQYVDTNLDGIRIPLQVNVTTPMLIVNDTESSSAVRVDENYGANITKVLYFNISNPGSYDLNFNFTGQGNLTSGGYNASLVYNLTNNTITTVPANSYKIIQVNMTFNNLMPIATYDGWLFFNATNTTSAMAAHPYSTYNLSLTLNLTRLLDVRILQIDTPNGDEKVYHNESRLAENVTKKMKIYYMNGTEIEAGNALNTSNFSVWLVETNTSYRIPASSNLTVSNGTNPLYYPNYPNGYYYINSTIPANQTGGRYTVYVKVNWMRGSYFFEGNGTNSSFIINNTGLYMSTPNSTSISIGNGSTYMFAVNVSNYGPVDASSQTIQFSESCSGYSVVATNNNGKCGCTGSCASGSTFTISPSAYNTSCLVWWTITAGSSAAAACTGNIIGSPTNKWFNPDGINVSVTVTAPAAPTPTPSPTSNITATTTTVPTTTTTIPTTPPPVNVTVNVSLITPQTPAMFNITQPEILKIQSIIVAVKNNVSNVSITVKESEKPANAPNVTGTAEGAVLKYLEISPTNIADANISNVTINFQVEKSWVTSNSIDVETIALYRYSNNTWNKLSTRKINESSDHLYFQSTSPGLSVFAIAGQKSKGFPWTTVLIIVGAIVVVVLGYLFWPVKEEKKLLIQTPVKEEKAEDPWKILKDKWDELTKKEKKT